MSVFARRCATVCWFVVWASAKFKFKTAQSSAATQVIFAMFIFGLSEPLRILDHLNNTKASFANFVDCFKWRICHKNQFEKRFFNFTQK
jgi:hypothetical protein